VKGAILQVITDTDRRGAQVFATELHDELVRLGRSVRTVALCPGRVGGLSTPSLGRRRLGVSTLRRLRQEIRRASVVVAHGSSTLPACALAGFGTGVPFVYRQISDSRFWAPSGLRRLRVRIALSRAAGVVALWSGAAETMQSHFGVPANRVCVIPNGVPTAVFLNISRDCRRTRRAGFGLDPSLPTVVYVGALVPEKGVDLLIESCRTLAGVQVLVVGDGPERQSFERLAAATVPGRVVFAGSTPDPVPALEAADVLVLASRGGDSMPAVLIEAGLAGLPTIATPVQGIPEIVVDGVTGVLVPTGDSDALASAIIKVTSDPLLASRLGAEARRRCASLFAIDVVAAQFVTQLDGVLGESDAL
jgi:glycosyltransferase involved in cell wall biosynthesis